MVFLRVRQRQMGVFVSLVCGVPADGETGGVRGSDTGLFGRQVHVGDGGHHGDQAVRGRGAAQAADLGDTLLHTAC